MDYGHIFGQAWQITKRWKSLWLLGLLSVLSMGLGTSVNPSIFLEDSLKGNLARAIVSDEIIAMIVAIGCLTFLLGIVVWVVSVISRGGLIAGVQQVAVEGQTSLGSAWSRGASRFWALFGISVLVILVGLAGIVVIALIIGTIFWLLSQFIDLPVLVFTSVFAGIVGLIWGAVVGVIGIYADQAAVQEDLGWLAAFRRGWAVLKDNLGSTIILVFFFLGILIGLIIIAVFVGTLLGVGLAAGIAALIFKPDPNTWLIAPLCCFGVIGVILLLIFEGFFQTFKTGVWTLAYRQMADLGGAPAAPAEAEDTAPEASDEENKGEHAQEAADEDTE